MNRRKLPYIFIPLLLFFSTTSSQYYNLNFRNYSSNNGLSQSEVSAVFQDREGFIWIGTHYGLTRYDGKEFRTYYHQFDNPQSLVENMVMDLDEDSHGYIWIAAYNAGLSRLDRVSSKFQNYTPLEKDSNSLINSQVLKLLIDRRDRVWVGTEAGLSIFDPAQNKFTNLPILPGETAPCWINSLDRDSSGNIFVGTSSQGLFRADSNLHFEKILSGKELPNIHKVLFTGNGMTWVGTSHGLYSFHMDAHFKPSNLERKPFVPSQFIIQDLDIDNNGNFWLATRRNGLIIYFPNSGFLDHIKENVTSARGLLSNRLSDIFKDNSGGIWVSGENGLQSFHDAAQKFYIYPSLSISSEKLRGSSIYGISEIDNDLLIATSGGILVYNRLANKFMRVDVQHELKDSSIRFRTIERENENTWWICSDFGMFELVRKTGYYILQRPPSLTGIALFKSESLRNYLRRNDGKIWVATSNEGLVLFDPSKKEMEYFRHDDKNPASLANDYINIISYDNDSNLLVGHDGGMSIIRKGQQTVSNIPISKPGAPHNLSSRYVYDFYDSGDSYWIATFGGGLNRMNKKDLTIRYYSSKQGLCSDAIYSIVPEGDKALWLGTNKGLSRFTLDNQKFENFGINDGMPADEFNMMSKYQNEDGEIFMGTITGLISFVPADINTNLIKPKVYLSRARLGGKYLGDSLTSMLNRDRFMTLQYGNDLYLEFSPMVYYGENNMVLKYNIYELGNEWKVGESGSLLPLVKMEPGRYTLGVTISDSQGKVQSSIWQFVLIVSPPFWQTLGFRLAVVLLLLITGILIVGNYIRRRLQKQRVVFERQQAVEKERSRISAELHDDIGGGLTAIRLLSEMNKERSRDESTRAFFQKISDSSNELIQKMNEIVWTLNVNNDNLQSLISYTRQYAVSYLDDLEIRCHVELPDQIPDFMITGNKRRTVFLLVKEALNNIAKHAQATAVNILISIGERLEIEVKDNGLGFDMQTARPGANGLINMQRRVEQLRGRLNIKSQNGTSVLFDIPLESLSS